MIRRGREHMASLYKTSPSLDLKAAETIALQGLGFLAEDPQRFARFLKVTGLQPGEVRRRAGERDLSLAVLEHLAEDESLLLVFTASRTLPPQSIGQAIARLLAQLA
jgi:hypothetical protein